MHKTIKRLLMIISLVTVINGGILISNAKALPGTEAANVQSTSEDAQTAKEDVNDSKKADEDTDKTNEQNKNYPHWEKENGKLFYYNEQGLMKKTGWFKVDDKEYYMNDDYSAFTGWKEFSGTWYYFDENGVMLKGWQYINYVWYYLGDKSDMQTGWIEVDRDKYYLNDSGSMSVGKNYIDGKWYYFANDGKLQTGFYDIDGKTYYSDDDGVMVTNSWIETKRYKYYIKGDSSVAKGKIIIDNEMVTFDNNGVYVSKESIGDEKYIFVKYFDAGNADCSFIKLPSGETALIDTGTVDSSNKLVEFLNGQDLKEKNGKKFIDYIILTHAHSDHIGGLKKVLENFEVGKVYLPDVGKMQEWHKNMKVNGVVKQSDIDMIKYDYLVYNDAVNAMNKAGLEFNNTVNGQYVDENKIMQFVQSDKDFGGSGSPDENIAKYYGLNNNSAIVYVNYGDYKGLFTGDIEWNVEKEFWSYNRLQGNEVNILKVPHHGLTTSSTGDFLKYISASVGVIPRAAESVVVDSTSYKNLINAGVVTYEVSDTENDGISVYSTIDNWSMSK